MARIVKVYCAGNEQKKVAEAFPVMQKYQGFVLVQIAGDRIPAMLRGYLIEDITAQYTLVVGGKRLASASRPRHAEKYPAGKHHYLVQFAGPILSEWLRQIRRAGGQPRVPYQHFVYVVRLDPRSAKRVAALPFVRWLGRYAPEARIATALREKGRRTTAATPLPRTVTLANVFNVEFFDARDLDAGKRALRSLRVRVIAGDRRGKVLTVEITRDLRRTLAAVSMVHGVRSIRERSIKRSNNDVAAGYMGTATALSPTGLGLSGAGETVGICDTGLDTGNPSTIHPDFSGRVKKMISYPITSDFSAYITNPGGDDGPSDLDSGHGTHTSGSFVGDGTASLSLPGQAKPIRGLAFKAKLVFQAVEQELKWKNPADLQQYGRYLLAGIPLDLSKVFNDARTNGARVHSNSWGGGDPGAYDTQCEQLDKYVWEHQDFCIVFAAGNDGTDKDGDGKINPTSVSAPGTAKNCITVGACENMRTNFNADTYGAWWPSDYPVAPYRNAPMADNPSQVAAFSSRGPTLDGRIKPDVVAPGTFILSTRSRMIAPNNTAWSPFPPSKLYFFMGGTSMATPLTAGAVAVVRQYLRTKAGISTPSAALMKACLIAGAQRIEGGTAKVFDSDQGFGRVSLDAVLAPAKPASAQFFDVKPGLSTGAVKTIAIKVRSKKAPLRVVLVYSDYPGRSLVNNLNLIVKSPSGTTYAGNGAPDAVNNVEAVRVTSPAAGAWTLQVVGSSVPQGPQAYALVVIGDLG